MHYSARQPSIKSCTKRSLPSRLLDGNEAPKMLSVKIETEASAGNRCIFEHEDLAAHPARLLSVLPRCQEQYVTD